MTPKAAFRAAAVWTLGGLAASFAWEMLQMPLYESFAHGAGWRRCFVAALGDVAMLALVYLAMAAACRSWLWFHPLSRGRVALLVGFGALAAIAVELHALAQERWSYASAMPRLPLLDVGWVPVLQMTLIPLALAFASRRWALRAGRDLRRRRG